MTAPSLTSSRASSKFVTPALYPGWAPSTVTSRSRPSASWPTALRAVRASSWSGVNCSFARKTGRPAFTSTGPPPSAWTTFGHAGFRIRRIFTVWPAGASFCMNVAAVPRATSTAPVGGIGVPPFADAPVTVAVSSWFGAAAGNDAKVSS